MNYTIAIGSVAGFLTTVAALPQLIKIIRSKSAQDISIGYFVLLTTGVGFWLVYGVLIHAWPVILANVFTFIIVASVLGCAIRYKQ